MNKIEKIKVSVDVALYYFTITTVVTILNVIFSNLLFKDSRQLFGAFSSNALMYAVLVVTILCLAILSNVLKRSSIDCKSLKYIIVGVLLIVGGVQNIASYVQIIILFLGLGKSVNDIYWAIVPIVLYILQIGIGVYFTLKTIKKDK